MYDAIYEAIYDDLKVMITGISLSVYVIKSGATL